MTGLLRTATACLLLTPLLAQAAPQDTPPNAVRMPHDSELELRGARIGRVEVEVGEVFENATRLAAPGLGNVLHIDLAFPLDRTSDIDSMQFIIETRRSF